MAVVMLTTYDNPTYMARAVAGGAAGYLLKGIEFDEMLTALRAVTNGEMLLDPKTLVRSLRAVSKRHSAACSNDLIEPLTTREEEVLRLLSTGLPHKEIATLLFVAESTIKYAWPEHIGIAASLRSCSSCGMGLKAWLHISCRVVFPRSVASIPSPLNSFHESVEIADALSRVADP